MYYLVLFITRMWYIVLVPNARTCLWDKSNPAYFHVFHVMYVSEFTCKEVACKVVQSHRHAGVCIHQRLYCWCNTLASSLLLALPLVHEALTSRLQWTLLSFFPSLKLVPRPPIGVLPSTHVMEGTKEIKSKIEARQSFVNITKCNVKSLCVITTFIMLILSLHGQKDKKTSLSIRVGLKEQDELTLYQS